MNGTNVSSLLQQVAALGKGLDADKGRQALLAGARQLVSALETPAERVTRMSWYEPTLQAAVRLGVDLKLFEKLIADGGKPKTASELAKETSCDPLLLERLLKHLATGDVVTETAVDTYAPNALTEAIADPGPAGMITNCHEGMAMTKARLVKYFRERDYKMPTNKDDTVFRYSAGLNMDWVEWMFAPGNEEHGKAFNNHMKFRTLAKKWYETAPVEEILGKPSADTDVLIVDVGGSTGHDLIGFHQAHPEYQGRLISQDLHSVNEKFNHDEVKPVEIEDYDFFTPQPIHGAKAYYLRRVMHGWPDAECRKILENLKPALKPGYSKILINEIVIPELGAQWYATSIDMFMLLLHSASERRTRAWAPLFESVGLKITKIHDIADEPEKLIEVELA